MWAKFALPYIPNATIRREALHARLTAARDCPLTLVTAAPGSGKTALLAEWARGLPRPVAWLSCDSDDTDGPTFWRNVAHAIRGAWEPVGLPGAEILDDDDPVVAVQALAHDLARLRVPGTIVIDDLHLARPDPAALVTFLSVLPPGVRLVIGSRSDPPFPLGRMRLHGTVFELRQSDLRFTIEETREALAALDVQASSSELQLIESLSEGWPAGVHLIALAIRSGARTDDLLRNLASSEQSIMDFLFDEVVGRQPTEVQEFMMLTAELEAFDAALCDAVTGSGDSAAMLERIAAENLFLTALDRPSASFRYHHLIGEFLRIRLRRSVPDRRDHVHRAAALAYSRRGDLRNAVRHSLLAGDIDDARALLGECITSVMSVDDRVTAAAVARTWLAEYGAVQLQQDPSGLFECMFALHVAGEADGVESWLQRWQRRENDLNHTARTLMHAAWTFHHVHTGDPAAALERGMVTKALLDEARIEGPWGSGLPILLVQAQLWLDDLEGARATLREARADPTVPSTVVEVRLNGLESQVELRAGELRSAELAARRAMRAGDRLELEEMNFGRAEPELTLAVLSLEHQQYEEADRGVERVMRIVEDGRRPQWELAAHMLAARLAAKRGDHSGAAARVALAQRAMPEARPLVLAHLDELQARLALQRGDTAEAQDHWCRLPPTVTSTLLEARIRLSVGDRSGALHALASVGEEVRTRRMKIEHGLLLTMASVEGDRARASEVLMRVLELAEPADYEETIVQEGPVVWRVLESLPAIGGQAAYVERLLTLAHHVVPVARVMRSSTLIEPLSERELTVLRYLASRLDSTAIASALFVSVNTVRSHVKAIYRKLDVKTRADAVARGRELGFF